MSNNKKFTDQERELLRQFKTQAETEERKQIAELIQHCTDKRQFAKTYRAYEEDWMLTRRQMEVQAEQGGQLSKSVLWEMIFIGDKLWQEKSSKLIQHFQFTWHESIFKYLGSRPSLESIQKSMGAEVDRKEKERTHKPVRLGTNRWPLILGLLAFFILVLLPVLSHQLSQ